MREFWSIFARTLYYNWIKEGGGGGGGVKGSMGCIDNLLIDKTVLEDASNFKKNLSFVWIDTRKAFDTVSHRWLIQILNLHRINTRIISLIGSIMRVWEITLEVTTDQGPTHIGPIDVNRGISQGDSFCVQLFTMCSNPIAWYIRSTEGYSIFKDKNRKVTHNYFVDDLKTYHKSHSKATLIINTVKEMFEDIGLSWGLQKCATVHIKKEK